MKIKHIYFKPMETSRPLMSIRCLVVILQGVTLILLFCLYISDLWCISPEADSGGVGGCCGDSCKMVRQRSLQSISYERKGVQTTAQRPDFVPAIPTHPQRILYNRVPKCGSHTFIDVIEEMAIKNHFNFTRASEYMQFHIEEYHQKKFVREVQEIGQPMLYERHIHFLNFTKFGQTYPVYINIIRDPLQRMISWYYFRRFQEGHVRDLPDEIRNRTFDECVRGSFTECVDMHGDNPEIGYFKIIPFFCGQGECCRIDGEKALRQAIVNLNKYYLIVGVTEQFSDFVGALELMLPSYFKGANNFFQKEGSGLKAKHKTMKKLKPADDVVQIMMGKLKNEYKFYHYVRQKFNRLLYELSLRRRATEHTDIARGNRSG